MNLKALQGLVIAYFGNKVAVERDDKTIINCILYRNQALPVVGDVVNFSPEPNGDFRVTNIESRRSELSRGDHKGQRKVLAANIDYMIIMMAPLPIYSAYLIDRYIVAAELLNITPIIVLNKVDLLDEAKKEAILQRLDPYHKLGYAVAYTSALKKTGLEDLNELIKYKTSVLVGPSGVGKSSMIAAFGAEAVRIGDVSTKGAGKHTTTATRLYHLPHDINLIDSPGVREFSLWTVSQQEIMRGFRELSQLDEACRFRDCKHLAEPGCAVQAEVKRGKINPDRYDSYVALMQTKKIK